MKRGKGNFRLVYMDKLLFFLMLALSFFGAIMVYSASNIFAVQKYHVAPSWFFTKQIIFIVIGLIAFLIVVKIPYRNYEKLLPIGFLAIYGMLFYVLLFGKGVNNAQAWIRVGPISIQPAEFAKIFVIVYLSNYYWRNANRLKTIKNAIFVPLSRIGGILLLVLVQPDLGTAVIIGFLMLILFFSSNTDWKIKKGVLLLIAVFGIVFILGKDTFIGMLSREQQERLQFREACHDYYDGGYHVCNSLIAINNGGLFGVGLGQSTQKYLYLLESHTDFIFAIVLEETGFLFSCFILLLYAYVIGRSMYLALKAPDIFGSLLCIGSSSLIFLHLFVNLGGISGFIPLTGVPFPLLSAGGSFIITAFCAFGMIQNVAIKINFPIQTKEIK